MNDCICVKQMPLKACVYTDVNRGMQRGVQRENQRQSDEEERNKRQKMKIEEEKR